MVRAQLIRTDHGYATQYARGGGETRQVHPPDFHGVVVACTREAKFRGVERDRPDSVKVTRE